MASLEKLKFHRLFAFQMYKNRYFPLSEMTFTSDFITPSKRCDLYPIIGGAGDDGNPERLENGTYVHHGSGEISRFFTRHFPVITYRIRVKEIEDGAFGISLILPDGKVSVLLKKEGGKTLLIAREARKTGSAREDEISENGSKIGSAEKGDKSENDSKAGEVKTEVFDSPRGFDDGMTLWITFRGKSADIYFEDESLTFAHSFTFEALADIFRIQTYERTAAALTVSGEVVLSHVDSIFDCGIAQADIRPIRYEDGRAIIENGKIYLTISIRFEEGMCTGILSWIPGTAEFCLVGALFFDDGSGTISMDVASSLLYDRNENKWLLWICSHRKHCLAHAAFDADIRHGIHVLDYTLVEPMEEGDGPTAFKGLEGDEDPDFVYDKARGKWLMTFCRLVTGADGEKSYRYFYYESDRPFSGQTFVSSAAGGDETGGSIVLMPEKAQFVCGSAYHARAEYHVYTLPDLSNFGKLQCDFDDGGFRGWGTVIPVDDGSRTRYYWLTFDRYLASESKWNWSYGNLFCFLAERDHE